MQGPLVVAVAQQNPPTTWPRVATTRAVAAYQTGVLVPSSTIEERLTSVGVPFSSAEERLVLAATGESLAGAMSARGPASRVGVGVVEGPYGLIAVVVTAV